MKRSTGGWSAAACLTALTLAGAPTAQAGLLSSKPGAVALTDASDRAQVYGLAVKAPEFNKYFKPSKRIAITSFRVRVSTGAEETSTRRSFLGDGATSSATLAFELQGVTPEMVQSMTDRLYGEYVQLLTDRGYEVVPAAELAANADYQKLVGKGNGTSSKQALMSANASIVGVARDASFVPGAIQMGSIKTENNLSVALGAMVVHVNLGLNFASLKEMTWLDVKTAPCETDEEGQCKASAAGMKGELRQSIAVANANDASQVQSSVDIITQWTFDQYLLKSTLVLPGELIQSVEKKPTSAGQAAAGILGMLAKSKSTSDTYQVTVTPDYEEKAAHDLRLVLEMFSEGLPKP